MTVRLTDQQHYDRMRPQLGLRLKCFRRTQLPPPQKAVMLGWCHTDGRLPSTRAGGQRLLRESCAVRSSDASVYR